MVYDTNVLLIILGLLNDDICSKCKAKRDVTADIDTCMLFLVPAPLCEPESQAAQSGSLRGVKYVPTSF